MKGIIFATCLSIAMIAGQFPADAPSQLADGSVARADDATQDGRGQADDPQRVNQVKPFMRAKLDHAQKVLEALALEDFDAMAKHSQEISLLSLAASWQVLQTPEYVRQSTEFRRAADTLTEAARAKNVDAATVAYVRMTFGCVDCHKYVRRVKVAAP